MAPTVFTTIRLHGNPAARTVTAHATGWEVVMHGVSDQTSDCQGALSVEPSADYYEYSSSWANSPATVQADGREQEPCRIGIRRAKGAQTCVVHDPSLGYHTKSGVFKLWPSAMLHRTHGEAEEASCGAGDTVQV